MASSNKKSSTSHDISTDTDDSDCAKNDSDFNNDEISSSTTKHRGYSKKFIRKSHIISALRFWQNRLFSHGTDSALVFS